MSLCANLENEYCLDLIWFIFFYTRFFYEKNVPNKDVDHSNMREIVSKITFFQPAAVIFAGVKGKKSTMA